MNMHRPDQIRQRAYEIWQAEGCPPESALRHWLTAESELEGAEKAAAPFKGFSVLGERDGGSAGNDKAAPAERSEPEEEVAITTGREPPGNTIKRIEGP